MKKLLTTILLFSSIARCTSDNEKLISELEQQQKEQLLKVNSDELIKALKALAADNSKEAKELKKMLTEIGNSDAQNKNEKAASLINKLNIKNIGLHAAGLATFGLGVAALKNFIETAYTYGCGGQSALTGPGFALLTSIVYLVAFVWFKLKNYFSGQDLKSKVEKTEQEESKLEPQNSTPLTLNVEQPSLRIGQILTRRALLQHAKLALRTNRQSQHGNSEQEPTEQSQMVQCLYNIPLEEYQKLLCLEAQVATGTPVEWHQGQDPYLRLASTAASSSCPSSSSSNLIDVQ